MKSDNSGTDIENDVQAMMEALSMKGNIIE